LLLICDVDILVLILVVRFGYEICGVVDLKFDCVALLVRVLCCWLVAGWLLVGCWLLVVGCWLLVVGCWLLVVGCWLLIADCWLLIVDVAIRGATT